MSGPARKTFVRVENAPDFLCAALLALVVCLTTSSPAHAQIYTWRDAKGQLVVSNIRPPSGAQMKSYAVPQTSSIRATRYAAADRSRLYDDLIVEHARLNGVRSDLVRAVVQVESAFNPNARSAKGAMGLMQLMPATARDYGVSNPFDPAENVRAGVAYLRKLLDRFSNDEELALAAYNAGPGAVDKYDNAVPPYRETRDYVTRINKMAGQRTIQPRSTEIYRGDDVVNGHVVPLYTDKKPTTGSYEKVK